MNLNEALTNVDKLCGVTPVDLKTQMHKVCQRVLGEMAARGRIHDNAAIVGVKDALNGVINEKAHHLITQYQRFLDYVEIVDYQILTEQLLAHAKVHLDQHYSEGCDQLVSNEQRILAGAKSPGIDLKDDYQRMMRWVEPEIGMVVERLRKEASSRAPTVARPSSKIGGLIPEALPCNSSNARVRNLCDELKRLSPAEYPNACAFTLRSFIEISAFCFLEAKGEVKKMHDDYLAEIAARNASRPVDKQTKPVADWTPDLSAMMKRLANSGNGLLKNHTTKALGKVLNEEEAIFGLNLSTHNPAYHPNEVGLRNTWQNLEEFFREILAP